MTPTKTRLTLDDLEFAAFTYGGTITRANAGWQLKTRINGSAVTLYAADEGEVRHG